MRVDLGPAAVDASLVLAGFGVLNAAGLLRGTLADSLAAIGLAFLAGISFVMAVAIALLTIGVPFRLPAFFALALATSVAGLLARPGWIGQVGLRRLELPNLETALRRIELQTWVASATLAAFVAYAVVGTLTARVRPLLEWDSWSIWTRKAEVLFSSGSLRADFFDSPVYAFMHLDYPILVPVLESVQFRAMGTIDTQAIHAQFWLMLVAFVWAILYLGLRRGTLVEWLPLVVAVSIVPAVYGQLLTAYADIPMALLLTLGTLLLGEWLATRDGRMLALSALFLVGSANTKNEGLMAAVIALAVAAVITATGPRPRRPGLKALAFGAGGFVAGILPWRVWLAAHGIEGDFRLREGLNPSYLVDHAGRIWPSVESFYAQLIDQANWLYVIPFGAGLTLVSLFIGQRRSIAAFYLATGLLAFAGLVWVYWSASIEPLSLFLATSANRVVAMLAAIAFAALLQLTPPLRDPVPDAAGSEPAHA
jgi:hypothetical protein